MRSRLSVVPTPARHVDLAQPRDEVDEVPLVVPVPRAGATPWATDDDGTAWVPAALLLAAAGRCSCAACCQELARDRARRTLTSV
ncbi:MAG: hypothetical protein JWM64_337 [Frankiales bacterium]|nr:hypothetical protein [Frankiales bacterium]